jgi:FHA domain
MAETSESSGLSADASRSPSPYNSASDSEKSPAPAASSRRAELPSSADPDGPAAEEIGPELIAAEASYPSGETKGTAGYAKLSGIGRGAIDYLVRSKTVTIGRAGFGADCQLRSDARTVSRHHATIHWAAEAETWAISCHSSSNALMVDGAPVIANTPPMPLHSRVLIEIGDAAFFFLAAVEPFCRTSAIDSLEDQIDRMRADRINTEFAKQMEEEAAKSRKAAAKGGSASGRALSGHRRSRRDNESDDEYGDDEVAQIDASFDMGDADGGEEDVYDDDDDDVALVVSNKRSSRHGSKKRKRTHSDEDENDDDARRRRRKDRKKKKRKKKRRRLEANLSCRPHDAETEDDDDQPEDVEEEDTRSPLQSGTDFEDPRLRPGRGRKRKVSFVANPDAVRADWNKKERADFCRAIFAVDVDKVYDADGELVTYDWDRFRGIAKLEKKTDAMLSEFYHRMMADMESLLEEEAREKRTKGPRTKHKPGCDCVVCENTRKSRRKKEEENRDDVDDPESRFGGDRGANADTGDGSYNGKSGHNEADDECKAEKSGRQSDATPRAERVLGLVTAQKLRVRMGIHEAARQVDSAAGQIVIRKLKTQPHSSAANGDLPEWWETGVHDHALMVGTARHGVGQWYDIWLDSHNPELVRARSNEGRGIEWPTTQVAMKRLREVSSAVNAEIRRVAKKKARRSDDGGSEDEERMRKPSGEYKRSARRGSGLGNNRHKTKGRPRDVSDDEILETFDSDEPVALQENADTVYAWEEEEYADEEAGYDAAEGEGEGEHEDTNSRHGDGDDDEGEDEESEDDEGEDDDGAEVEEIELEMEEIDIEVADDGHSAVDEDTD